MKKILIPIILLIVILVGYFALGSSSSDNASSVASKSSSSASNETSSRSATSKTDDNESAGQSVQDDYDYDIDIRPATEIYSDADDAYLKIMEASKSYDDLVLEQFAELDDDCAWCPELYQQVKETMLSTTDENEKSYLAELLAVTGKVDNVDVIVSAYEGSESDDDRDIFLEALEFTAGDDDLVEYLDNKLDTDDELLQESLVAAITNHGSRLAVESLYDQTVKAGDPDGFYALGIGIGEVIPDESSLPYIIEKANQEDKYSHLFIKSLLNYGDEGLREAIAIISSSDNSELNQQRLTDAIDHVTYDDDTERYLKELSETTSHADVKKFADEVLEDMAIEFDYDDDYEDDDY